MFLAILPESGSVPSISAPTQTFWTNLEGEYSLILANPRATKVAERSKSNKPRGTYSTYDVISFVGGLLKTQRCQISTVIVSQVVSGYLVK